MNRTLKTILTIVAVVCATISLNAQDLQSQRGESQDLGKLLGNRVDHGGIVINPQPQQITIGRPPVDMLVDISQGVVLKGEAKNFVEELNFVKHSKKGVKLTIKYAKKGFASELMPDKSGAYTLDIDYKKGIEITAYDNLAAFYAIQTLRQIVESPLVVAKGAIPTISICDWPDLKYRGVVEGFYGEPWSHATRLSLIDFYGRFKMNYYIYGPKDDPYHSSPYWREAYPEKEAQQIRELVEACKRNRVHFVWAIHPGKDIQWNETDLQNLINKFEAMYALGVRAFAVHFDDIEGAGANPYPQTELMNILNTDFVKVKGDVEPLIVCPTEYTRLWANPTERGSLIIYGNTLDPSVDVFWTGDAVCSNMTESTMEWISSRIKRPALFWWNFPVTDYARHIIMQGPVYGLASTMDSTKTRGIVSNPMEHGEASKLALYSTADYAWSPSKYNPVDSWERAIECVAPEVKEPYRLFAIHSCDTETGYRRLESWETETFTLAEYDAEVAAKLLDELRRIEQVPAQMEAMQNKALLEELRPWLVEFGKLGTRCRKAIECLETYLKGDYDTFWNLYVDNLMTEEQIAEFDAHRCGTMKLHPFYERLMDDMAAAYYESLTGEKSSVLSAVGSYASLQAPQAKYMFDNDPETYYHSGQAQRTDHFLGVDLGVVRPVREVRIIQGRNSVDDVDYFDHCVLEYSVDGETWTALTEPMQGVYDIEWKGEPVEARYVGIRKLESAKRNWLAIRSFEINPVAESEYGWDANPFTSYRSEGAISVAVPKDKSAVQMLFGKLADKGYVTLFNKHDKEVGRVEFSSSNTTIELPKGVTRIEINASSDLYELMFK
ncbi:MAG: beta-N-acetylglucosaminidase domain-containing protein [Alistipes sp.]|nr:beta-N-acetylglucosaminidase domain-containing protein [Alistipes sp.]